MYKWDSNVLSAGRKAIKISATEQKENPSPCTNSQTSGHTAQLHVIHTHASSLQAKEGKTDLGLNQLLWDTNQAFFIFLSCRNWKQSHGTHPGSQVARRGPFAFSHCSSEGRGCLPEISTPEESTWSIGRDAQLCLTHGWVGVVQLLSTF